MRQTFHGTRSLRQRLAIGAHQGAGERGRRGNRDLLAENSAHGQLEAVPRPRNSKPGPCADERSQPGVERKVSADDPWLGGQVQHPTDASDDGRLCSRVREPHPQVHAVLGCRLDTEHAAGIANCNCSRIAPA